MANKPSKIRAQPVSVFEKISDSSGLGNHNPLAMIPILLHNQAVLQ